MTAPLTMLLDVVPVLAMVLVIVCIPLLGDRPPQRRQAGNEGKRGTKASGGLSVDIPFRGDGDGRYRPCVLEILATWRKNASFRRN
jgi:hypothetical protein